MTLRTWTVIGLLAVTSAVGAAVVVGQAARKSTPDKPTAPLPALYVPDDQQDLGDVWEAPDAALPVVIANRSDKDVEISDFQTSCDCTSVEPRTLTVPAHGTATSHMVMDSTRRTAAQAGMVRRIFHVSVRPSLADGTKGPQLEWRYTAKSLVTFDRDAINFSDWCVAGQPPLVRIVRGTLHCEAASVTASVTNDKAVTLQTERPTMDTVALRVSPNTARPAGPFEATVTVTATLASGEVLKSAVIPVTGTLAAK